MNHKHSFPKNKTFQPQRFVFRSPWIRKWLFSPSRFFPKSSFLRPKMAPGVEKLGPLKSLHCSWLRIPGLDPHFQNPSSAGFGFFGFKKKRFANWSQEVEASPRKLTSGGCDMEQWQQWHSIDPQLLVNKNHPKKMAHYPPSQWCSEISWSLFWLHQPSVQNSWLFSWVFPPKNLRGPKKETKNSQGGNRNRWHFLFCEGKQLLNLQHLPRVSSRGNILGGFGSPMMHQSVAYGGASERLRDPNKKGGGSNFNDFSRIFSHLAIFVWSLSGCFFW